MKRLIIKKLILISNLEKTSLEIPFKEGLNLILGKNKTGKSSIIKSIFYTFGCDVRIDKEWKQIINQYAVLFNYSNKHYIIRRKNDKFSLYETDEFLKDIVPLVINDTISDKLMDILNVNFKLLNYEGESVRISLPHLFAFQYIDQDIGWNNIGTSFKNLGGISKWKSKVINYVVGYYSEEYFIIKEKIERLNKDIKDLNSKIEHIEIFINDLIKKEEYEMNEDKNALQPFPVEIQELLNKMNLVEKERIKLKNQLAETQNKRYEAQLLIRSLNKYEEELVKDINFAETMETELECPFCGTLYENTLEQKTEIIKDIQNSKALLKISRNDLKDLNEEITRLENDYHEKNNLYLKFRRQINKIEEGANVVEAIKKEGKREIIFKSNNDIKELKNQRNYLVENKYIKEELLKCFNSSDNKNIIKKAIINKFTDIFERLCQSKANAETDGFLIKLEYTGSELPRAVYAYYIALYLYNLDRKSDLFRLLIIDTPNQQGQDTENLSNIFNILYLLTSEEGQVILGSERDTGIEEKATNVVRLKESRHCLTKDSFIKHRELFCLLENLEINEMIDEKVKEVSNTIVDSKESVDSLDYNKIKDMQISIFDSIENK